MLQRELGILVFATAGWALVTTLHARLATEIFHSWSCLGMLLANTARSDKDPTAPPAKIFAGQYLEAAVSIPTDRRQGLQLTRRILADCHTGCISFHWKLRYVVYQITRGSWTTHIRMSLRLYLCR